MINAEELRIGNIVENTYGNIFPVDASKIYRISCGDLSNIKPVPLTEEWLLRFGFESNSYQDRYENKIIHVECNKTRGFTELWIDRMPHIKYVHQLQNLFFALRDKELILSEAKQEI